MIFLTDYGFLSFAKNSDKNTGQKCKEKVRW